VRIEQLVTSGQFHLDGGSWDVDNNVWIIGDADEVIIVDAPHDADAIEAAVGGRKVVAIACTHAHDDHVNVAPELGRRFGAPVLLNPADDVLWRMAHPDARPDGELADGQRLEVAGTRLEVLVTPGHAPGAVCFYAPGPPLKRVSPLNTAPSSGATGRSYSDFPTILTSIEQRLFALPGDTIVHTGHGDDTSVAAEAPHLDEWRARGN
jgi:glyoxylase-like metal-dependent hydrolase (beta-lactamase superfamily II)